MIKNLQGRIRLRDGVEMPGFGYGSYKGNGAELQNALAVALDFGYRLIDTASFYKNEKATGEALKKSPVSRDKLFIVSKIWPSQFWDPVKALDASLRELGLDWLDGYLLHWPGQDEQARFHAWEVLLGEKEKGKIRVLGVSNFLERHLEQLYSRFDHWPSVNQIEVHPDYQETGLCNFCQQREVAVMAWSPLGRGSVFKQALLVELGKKYHKTPAQIALRWQVQMGYIPLPKSINPSRIRENAEIFNFSLTEGEMASIHGLNLPGDQGRIGKDPDLFPTESLD